jgi:predicted RNA binding protein YcfA (HicA-like mRNA interferase family)
MRVLRNIALDNRNGKEIITRLKKEGWILVRVNGSHHIMRKESALRDVPIPLQGSKDLGMGVIKSIEKQSGVKLR